MTITAGTPGEPSWPRAAVGEGVRAVTWRVVLGVAAFHAAYAVPELAPVMVVFFGCLLSIARRVSVRWALRVGLVVGAAAYVPYLWFFWGVFHSAAIALWLIVALYPAVFLMLAAAAYRALRDVRGGVLWAGLLAAAAWTGLEYFRSELYYLRFSWLSAGFATSGGTWVHFLPGLGVYGWGFILMLAAAVWLALRPLPRVLTALAAVGAGLSLMAVGYATLPPMGTPVRVTGLQIEHADTDAVLGALDRAAVGNPQTDLYMLPEYTFATVPRKVREWCIGHHTYLLAGAIAPLEDGQFYNTAVVIGPDGKDAFTQVKAVPIQFFTDGLPAPRQRVWPSPWGKLGVCVCYDLSYSRVTDELVRQGAEAILTPAMDPIAWGPTEHRLHGMIGPARAAEYAIPIVRVCSSGVSQVIDRSGRVDDAVAYPGQGEVLAGTVWLNGPGTLPLDRQLVWACIAISVAGYAGLALRGGVRRLQQKRA